MFRCAQHSRCSFLILPAGRAPHNKSRTHSHSHSHSLVERPPRNTCAQEERTLAEQVVEQRGPLVAEDVGAGEAAVAADAHEVRDAVLDEVQRGCLASLASAELVAARAPDDRPALRASCSCKRVATRVRAPIERAHQLHHARHDAPSGFLDVRAALDEPFVALRAEYSAHKHSAPLHTSTSTFPIYCILCVCAQQDRD